MTRLSRALQAIDTANAADPVQDSGHPAALIYGQRMSAELARLFPAASEVLQVAARGQHVERWLLQRADFPEGRIGYLDWRREQGLRHGARLAAIMAEAGFSADDQDRVGVLLRKERIKRDAEVQALEDVICFTFLRWYFAAFATRHDTAALVRIVGQTARKMSQAGRARAVQEFALPAPFAAAFSR